MKTFKQPGFSALHITIALGVIIVVGLVGSVVAAETILKTLAY